jgi:hypothetical protein
MTDKGKKMTDREKTNNQLYTERDSIELQLIEIEKQWESKGVIEAISATEYDRLSRRLDELTYEVRRPNRWNGP